MKYTTAMKCEIEHEALLSHLLEAQRFVASKGFASALLGGIQLEVSGDDKLTFRSSTGSVLYQAEIPCQSADPGSVVVPAGLLVSSVKSLTTGQVGFEVEADQLVVTQGSTRFQIAALSGEEFPRLADEDKAEKFLLPVEKFMKAGRQVLIAASADETKPVLTSILLEMRQPNSLVATDGFRLMRTVTDISLDQEGSLLLPAKVLRDLLGILEKRSVGVLECYADKGRSSVLFNLGNGWLKSATIVGDYPSYRSIIPEACSYSLVVEREPLLQAVRQAMIFAKEYSGIVVLEVENGELVVASQSSTSGRTRSRLPVIKIEGEPNKFAVNGRYLIDFLGITESLEVKIQGNEPLRPVLFTLPEDDSLLYLVMPFKLQE
jgi:DNA polymerase-3 subunit beta